VNQQRGFIVERGQARERGKWNLYLVPNAAHVEQSLIWTFVDEFAAKRPNHFSDYRLGSQECQRKRQS
jgi:hypothetical protein